VRWQCVSQNKILNDKLISVIEAEKIDNKKPSKLLGAHVVLNNSIFAIELEKAKKYMGDGFKSRYQSFSMEQVAKEKANYIFYITIMEAVLEFPVFASANIDEPITEEEESALASDEATATTLGYAIASMTYMLNTQAGFNRDQVYNLLEPIFNLAIIPYAEQAIKKKPKTLKSFSSFEAQINEYPELERIKKVSDLLMQNIGNQDQRSLYGNYAECIFRAVENNFSSEESRIYFFGKMMELGNQRVGEYLTVIDGEIEKALIDYLSALQEL
jgi:hypothetical protein